MLHVKSKALIFVSGLLFSFNLLANTLSDSKSVNSGDLESSAIFTMPESCDPGKEKTIWLNNTWTCAADGFQKPEPALKPYPYNVRWVRLGYRGAPSYSCSHLRPAISRGTGGRHETTFGYGAQKYIYTSVCSNHARRGLVCTSGYQWIPMDNHEVTSLINNKYDIINHIYYIYPRRNPNVGHTINVPKGYKP